MAQTVVFDFDGVIHSYTSGWKGNDSIPDPPVPGIKEAIAEIRAAGYKVVVVSTRCATTEGYGAIRAWLIDNGIEVDDVKTEKPPAVVYIDDRAICFDGHPETLLQKIQAFRPWNKEVDTMEERLLIATEEGTFSWALEMLRNRQRLRRRGWNGKGQYIELAKAISYKGADGTVVNCEHEAIGNKAIAFCGTSGVQMGWLASQADMLADDWEVAE